MGANFHEDRKVLNVVEPFFQRPELFEAMRRELSLPPKKPVMGDVIMTWLYWWFRDIALRPKKIEKPAQEEAWELLGMYPPYIEAKEKRYQTRLL